METEIDSDTAFLFTKLPVERQLFADIQGLNQFTPEILQAITELILSFLAQQVLTFVPCKKIFSVPNTHARY